MCPERALRAAPTYVLRGCFEKRECRYTGAKHWSTDAKLESYSTDSQTQHPELRLNKHSLLAAQPASGTRREERVANICFFFAVLVPHMVLGFAKRWSKTDQASTS